MRGGVKGMEIREFKSMISCFPRGYPTQAVALNYHPRTPICRCRNKASSKHNRTFCTSQVPDENKVASKCPPAPGDYRYPSSVESRDRESLIMRDRSPREAQKRISIRRGIREFKAASKCCPRMKAQEGGFR